ncbi:transposase (plasmid) [Microvirga sp. VF16]|nr:transposase [Microvirga sp. VF16]
MMGWSRSIACIWVASRGGTPIVHYKAREFARGPVHTNSAEGFNDRIHRTVPGVFHNISPHLADLYFNEIGFRWAQCVVTG